MQNGPKRRFPPPWRVEPISGGFTVVDAAGITLAYIYANTAKMASASNSFEKLTVEEAWRIANGIAKLPKLLSRD